MPITVLSPHDGTPVKIRDQDVGRAVRDREGRIFYVLAKSDGSGYYGAMTRAGGEKDERRYMELEAKTKQADATAQANVAAAAAPHDARGRGRPMMGRFVLLLLILAAAGAVAWYLMSQEAVGQDQAGSPFEDNLDRVSYAIGVNMGSQFASQGLEVDPELVARGLSDALNGRELLMSREQMNQAIQQLQAEQQAERQGQAEQNKAKGEAFLEQNAQREQVKVTESGLQYEVLKEGSGPSPTAESEVTTHYHGTLLDGTVFDSSYERGEPATFPVSGVIPAWTEALQMMKEGGKWKIYAPAELAYGERGAGSRIGPNETLVFEIELLDVKAPSGGGDGSGGGE